MAIDCVWNVMAHAQKPDFVFRRNGRVHLNRQGASVQSITDSRGVRISGSNAGYTMWRGSVKSTGYPLHSPFSPFTSPPVRHRVPSHFNWTRPHFSKLSHKQRDFRRGKSCWTKNVFWFSLQILSETFLVLRRIQRNTIINVQWPSCEVPVIRVRF
jgi:hypothetical protein